MLKIELIFYTSDVSVIGHKLSIYFLTDTIAV